MMSIQTVKNMNVPMKYVYWLAFIGATWMEAESSTERGRESQREEEVGVLLVLMQADGWRLRGVVLFMQAADCLGYVVCGRW